MKVAVPGFMVGPVLPNTAILLLGLRLITKIMDTASHIFYTKLLAKLQLIASGELSLSDYIAEVEAKTQLPIRQQDTISNQELNLIVDLFKKRSVDVAGNDSMLHSMKSVLMTGDVIAILQMLQAGKFTAWYQSCKKHGHPDFE
jgi:hypothetical protein